MGYVSLVICYACQLPAQWEKTGNGKLLKLGRRSEETKITLQLRHYKNILPRDTAFANRLADLTLALAVAVAE